MLNLERYMAGKRRLIDRELARILPPAGARPAVLHKAMRYAVLSGGKRIRPILCMAAAEAAGGSPRCALFPALAVEILHSYTLVHDDLPCMDDDDLRRGRPTVHRAFGEATALLAGDSLLTLSFGILACAQVSPTLLVAELAAAAGSTGVIGGQQEDISATGKKVGPAVLNYIHMHKTADLIRCSVRMGAISAGASRPVLGALSTWGENIGLAFQVVDDILNATSTAKQLGKPVGSDREQGKLTYVSVHGLAAARKEADRLTRRAGPLLRRLPGDTRALSAIAGHLAGRLF